LRQFSERAFFDEKLAERPFPAAGGLWAFTFFLRHWMAFLLARVERLWELGRMKEKEYLRVSQHGIQKGVTAGVWNSQEGDLHA
jgi:hypothetical protein